MNTAIPVCPSTMPQKPRGTWRQLRCGPRRSRTAVMVDAATQSASTMPKAACHMKVGVSRTA